MKKKHSILILLLFSFLTTQASFITHKPPADTSVHSTELTTRNLESVIGRKLNLKEKIILFLTKRRINKEVSRFLPGNQVEEDKANNNAKWSFICALLSFITPLMIIPAIILKTSANNHKELLTTTSINRLKVVNGIAKFWQIMFYILIVATFLLFIGVVIWFFATILKGAS